MMISAEFFRTILCRWISDSNISLLSSNCLTSWMVSLEIVIGAVVFSSNMLLEPSGCSDMTLQEWLRFLLNTLGSRHIEPSFFKEGRFGLLFIPWWCWVVVVVVVVLILRNDCLIERGGDCSVVVVLREWCVFNFLSTADEGCELYCWKDVCCLFAYGSRLPLLGLAIII